MSNANQQASDTSAQISPLERLHDILATDMDQVNARILEHLQSDVEIIPKIAEYLIEAGGKRIRPLLTLACARIYGYQGDRPYNLAASVEFIHTATLLHDDVVDESDQRRGKKAANLVFGNQTTVLVGDFLFSRAFQLMVADQSLPILKILSDASAIITQGEVKQLAIAQNLDTNFEDYLDVVKSKTAALFSASCEIGPVIAEQPAEQVSAMHEFGLNLGIAFQIIDDVLDYSAKQSKLGKSIGDDFYEGKMTAPVILLLEKASAEERAFVEKTFVHGEFDDNALETMTDLLKKHDCLTKTAALASEYGEKAKQALKTLPDSEIRSLLSELVDYTLYREV